MQSIGIPDRYTGGNQTKHVDQSVFRFTVDLLTDDEALVASTPADIRHLLRDYQDSCNTNAKLAVDKIVHNNEDEKGHFYKDLSDTYALITTTLGAAMQRKSTQYTVNIAGKCRGEAIRSANDWARLNPGAWAAVNYVVQYLERKGWTPALSTSALYDCSSMGGREEAGGETLTLSCTFA